MAVKGDLTVGSLTVLGNLTSAERDARTNVSNGSLIFNTTSQKLQYREDSEWKDFLDGDTVTSCCPAIATGTWNTTQAGFLSCETFKPDTYKEENGITYNSLTGVFTLPAGRWDLVAFIEGLSNNANARWFNYSNILDETSNLLSNSDFSNGSASWNVNILSNCTISGGVLNCADATPILLLSHDQSASGFNLEQGCSYLYSIDYTKDVGTVGTALTFGGHVTDVMVDTVTPITLTGEFSSTSSGVLAISTVNDGFTGTLDNIKVWKKYAELEGTTVATAGAKSSYAYVENTTPLDVAFVHGTTGSTTVDTAESFIKIREFVIGRTRPFVTQDAAFLFRAGEIKNVNVSGELFNPGMKFFNLSDAYTLTNSEVSSPSNYSVTIEAPNSVSNRNEEVFFGYPESSEEGFEIKNRHFPNDTKFIFKTSLVNDTLITSALTTSLSAFNSAFPTQAVEITETEYNTLSVFGNKAGVQDADFADITTPTSVYQTNRTLGGYQFANPVGEMTLPFAFKVKGVLGNVQIKIAKQVDNPTDPFALISLKDINFGTVATGIDPAVTHYYVIKTPSEFLLDDAAVYLFADGDIYTLDVGSPTGLGNIFYNASNGNFNGVTLIGANDKVVRLQMLYV